MQRRIISNTCREIWCEQIGKQVQSYKYLGSTVNSDNSIEEEIQNRITLGNKAHCANQFLFKSRMVSKKLKMELYWSIIRPIVCL
jgi:hypothetical protein